MLWPWFTLPSSWWQKSQAGWLCCEVNREWSHVPVCWLIWGATYLWQKDQNFRQEFSSRSFQFPGKICVTCVPEEYFPEIDFCSLLIQYSHSLHLICLCSPLGSWRVHLCAHRKMWRLNWNLCLHFSCDELDANKCLHILKWVVRTSSNTNTVATLHSVSSENIFCWTIGYLVQDILLMLLFSLFSLGKEATFS